MTIHSSWDCCGIRGVTYSLSSSGSCWIISLWKAGRCGSFFSPGTYGVAAFVDRNADLIYQPGEPFLRVDQNHLLVCASGEEKRDIALVIPEGGTPTIAGEIDIAALQARTVHDQLTMSLGLLTASRAITTLDDPRFSMQSAESGLWAPFDFVFNFRPGSTSCRYTIAARSRCCSCTV